MLEKNEKGKKGRASQKKKRKPTCGGNWQQVKNNNKNQAKKTKCKGPAVLKNKSKKKTQKRTKKKNQKACGLKNESKKKTNLKACGCEVKQNQKQSPLDPPVPTSLVKGGENTREMQKRKKEKKR